MFKRNEPDGERQRRCGDSRPALWGTEPPEQTREMGQHHSAGVPVGTIPEDHQTGQPHYPVRTGSLFRQAHVIPVQNVAVQPRVAERSGDGASQCQPYALATARGYSGIL